MTPDRETGHDQDHRSGMSAAAGAAARPFDRSGHQTSRRRQPAVAAAAGGRRPEFDVLRALVVAGLVSFHSAVVFAAGASWFVKDPRPSIGFTVFLL